MLGGTAYSFAFLAQAVKRGGDDDHGDDDDGDGGQGIDAGVQA